MNHQDTYDQLLARLEGVRRGSRPGQWEARCPAHDDRVASLGINLQNDRLLLHCHAGCDYTTILTAVGLEKPSRDQQPSDIIDEYIYTDESGTPLFKVMRLVGKEFRQAHWDPNCGEWVWGVRGIRQVPYKLPELIAGVQKGRTVFIVEGEKDVHTLNGLGLVATCNAGGAGKWRQEWAELFRGAKVVVLPDNDDAGANHADVVAQALRPVAKSFKVIRLPGIPDKGDVTDWVSAGGKVSDLHRLVDDYIDPTAERPLISRLSGVTARRTEFIWGQRIPVGKLTLIIGDPGEGKSFITMSLAAAITTGDTLPCDDQTVDGEVLFIPYEDDPEDTIRPRADALGVEPERFHLFTGFTTASGVEREFGPADVAVLDDILTDNPEIRVIVIDPIAAFMAAANNGTIDAHKDVQIRAALQPLARLGRKHRIAILGVIHMNKNDQQKVLYRASGSIGFIGLARSALLVGTEPNSGRKGVAHLKHNLSPKNETIEFRIVDGTIEWLGEAPDLTPEVLTAAPKPETEDMANAVDDWLLDYLSHGARRKTDVVAAATEAGFSKNRCYSAMRRLNVQSSRGFGEGAWWSLPTVADTSLSRDSSAGQMGEQAS